MTFGFPRMHKEAGERRDFLPELVKQLCALGAEVFVEAGIGSGMGLGDEDYARVSSQVQVVDARTAYQQDVVVVLRCPELEELEQLRRGATLVSMIHFPTRPTRIQRLTERGLQAISLDSLADDEGKRLVENMRAVGWNGLEAAFAALERTYPQFQEEARAPIRVTVMGAGLVGKHAVEAATKYGSRKRAAEFDRRGLPGAEVTVLGRSLTGRWRYMRDRLQVTDILVDASQRSDPSRPLIPNAWIAWLPSHAVICDLVVDPYLLDADPPTVRSIEGIPRGNLDQYRFAPEDPAWSRTVPESIACANRRTVVSCYSWPGVHPKECMAHYGVQLAPLLERLITRGTEAIEATGDFLDRALYRASLRTWTLPHPPYSAELDADEGEAY
jgi:alanine dehydrogenase